LKVIIDFDGTLTAEETQTRLLAEKSLDTLANEIIGAPRRQLTADYEVTQTRLLQTPHRYWCGELVKRCRLFCGTILGSRPRVTRIIGHVR